MRRGNVRRGKGLRLRGKVVRCATPFMIRPAGPGTERPECWELNWRMLRSWDDGWGAMSETWAHIEEGDVVFGWDMHRVGDRRRRGTQLGSH